MGFYKEVEGDLIKLAKKGDFDVIVHGCNCKSTMGAGIAPQMARAFGCNLYPMELIGPTLNKLGCIDFQQTPNSEGKPLYVINAYTQYDYRRNNSKIPLDYEALTLCMRKINEAFANNHIGLPQIGSGLAGGNWETIKKIIQTELKNCDVTIVIYKP